MNTETPPAPDSRRKSPSTARNRGPILEALREILPARGRVLEIASGAGEHAVFFARALPDLTWQPSDLDADARASIEAWRAHERLANVTAPLALDVMDADWARLEPFDAMVCINMIHISPWEASLALMAGAREVLESGGVLFLYGPFMRDGRHTSESNAAFDASLRARNSAWGVRALEDIVHAAKGFRLERVIEMPANNLSLVLRRA